MKTTVKCRKCGEEGIAHSSNVRFRSVKEVGFRPTRLEGKCSGCGTPFIRVLKARQAG